MAPADSDKVLSDPVGQDFGPYKLVRRLGVGGMAETFEAIRTGPGDFTQRVCIKLVLPFFRDREDFRELFEREARLAAKLRHSNVVGVIDFGQIDGVTYIALELVDGVDLASLLDAQPGQRLSSEQVVFLGHQLAAGLEHAHDPRREGSADGTEDNAIVHRDISPSNVLISQRGEIMLTDFGVAKAITGSSRQQSAVKGKVPYMSPEQLRAEKLDGRADLFALGVVLFEALAGERPYHGEHDPATIMRILQGERAALRDIAPDTPEGVCDVIDALLQPDRDERPKNAAALLEMLDPFMPSPRVGRQLGNMASEVRAAKLLQTTPAPIVGNEPTDMQVGRPGEASGVSVAGSARPRDDAQDEKPPAKASRTWLPWALLALVLSAVGVWALQDLGGTPANTSGPAPPILAPADPEPTTPPALPPGNESSGATAESEADAAQAVPQTKEPPPPAAEPEVKPARLTVVVFPWGEVWINGKRRGAAPLKSVALEPGRYRISAGQGRPSQTKTVQLREGQRRTVQFDLTQ